jgi:tetratricopeptide (TPR) repeat protein
VVEGEAANRRLGRALWCGGFERVERLLQMSQRKQRAKRWSVAAAFVAVAGLAIAMTLLWQNAERAQTEAEASRRSAFNSTRISIFRLADFLNDGTLSAKKAELLLSDARSTLEALTKNENQSPEISVIEVSLLLSFSDVRVALGDHDDALKRAERAAAISERLLKRDPYDQNLMRQIYAASFRIGDEKVWAGDNSEAERQYNKALGFARQRAAIDPDNPDRKRDVVFILNKLADLERLKKNWKTALDYYSDGLKIAEAQADKYPIDTATQKNRIAQLLSERGEHGDAQAVMAGYREALAIQSSLLQTSPDDATLLSNAALTHRRIGQLLKDKPEEALIEFRAAVANRKKLFESDPASVPWRTGLAVDYKLLGDTMLDLEDKDYRGALQNYSAASQIEEALVQKDPGNLAWQRTFAVTSVKRGDILIARGNEALVNPEPAVDETTRRIGDALVRYQRAAGIFEKLVTDPKAGGARFANLFDVRIKIGDVLTRQEDYKEALESYQSALAVAAMAPPSQRIVDWQIRATDAIAQACDVLAHETAGGSAAAALPGNDQPDALACYQKASAAIEAAAVKDPENPEVKTRRAALSAKIEAQRSAAK